MNDFQAQLLNLLREVRLQLIYLDEKVPTGTTPAFLARINDFLARSEEEQLRSTATAAMPEPVRSSDYLKMAHMWAVSRDALESIRHYCRQQPSALTRAVVATCDQVLWLLDPINNTLDDAVEDACQRTFQSFGNQWESASEQQKAWYRGLMMKAILPLYERINSLTWQVRDTCTRAEKAEAALAAAASQSS